VFLYDPADPAVGTGSGSVNGVSFAGANQVTLVDGFVEDENYLAVYNIDVTSGTLAILGALNSGVAAMEIYPGAVKKAAAKKGVSKETATKSPAKAKIVPEAGSLGSLASGLLAVFVLALMLRQRT
jgi:hypothetical protein